MIIQPSRLPHPLAIAPRKPAIVAPVPRLKPVVMASPVEEKSKLCFWSVGTGRYSDMLRYMVHTYRAVGMTEDFHVYTDHHIKGAYCHPIGAFPVDSFYFKFKFLRNEVKKLAYDWFVYLDADTYWLHSFQGLEKRLNANRYKSFCVMESDISNPAVAEKQWWGWPLASVCALYRKRGIKNKRIYNTNGGLFAVHKDHIDEFCDEVEKFRIIAASAGWPRTVDEPSIAYTVHKMNPHVEAMTVQANPDLWACRLEKSGNAIPIDNTWNWTLPYGGAVIVNPAILHLVGKKELLIAEGKRLLT